MPALSEIEGQLRSELARERAEERFAEIRTKLADSAYAADDLAGPAEELGLEVREAKGITRNGGTAPFDHEGLVRQLFSADVVEDGYNTELIDVGDNVSVVARVREYREAQQLALEEVAADVRASLKAQETRAALSERADEIIAGLEAGKSLSELGAEEWASYEAKPRNDQEAGAAVMRTVFSLSRPAEGETSYGQSVSGSSAAVVALDGVNEGAVDETSEEFGQLEEFLASLEGQREYGAYQQFLRNRAEVERP
ncbi:peptidyl-prolyl isomerase family protein [Marinobacter similis]|uniref:hypothetical protein n=1 Tax=Marinobacter similis TaxID=1420916 RepID=UPI000A5615B4|nr:hypothetical protein [Marinobacter similis]